MIRYKLLLKTLKENNCDKYLLTSFSVGCMGISMGLLGFSMYCQDVDYEFSGLRIIPLISIILYTLSYGSGIIIQKSVRTFLL